MVHADESTCPLLLGEVRDWDNHAAWVRLLARHDPLIRRCCQGLRLNDADEEEVRQETWIEVAKRVRRFRYDPGRSFRNWLWVVCRHKAVSYLRMSGKRRIQSLEEWMAVSPVGPEPRRSRSRIAVRRSAANPGRGPFMRRAAHLGGLLARGRLSVEDRRRRSRSRDLDRGRAQVRSARPCSIANRGGVRSATSAGDGALTDESDRSGEPGPDSTCYSDEWLRRLGDDDLDPEVLKAMERHIAACPRCQERLIEIGEEGSSGGRAVVDALADYDGRLPEVPGFEIESELGRGNMGVVYLARKTGQSRPLALKLMPQSAFPGDGPNDRRRWNREALAASSVRHPNIVTLYDYGEVGRWFFLAFEYVPGGSLKERLGKAPLPPRTAAEVLRKIADAVAHVHAKGLLHLDLKPPNILLDAAPDAPWDQVVPKVSDFGVSLSPDDLATPEASMHAPRGTPAYMAPEQTGDHRGKIGPQADVHALGANPLPDAHRPPPLRGPDDP